jgi:hypothetical protein
MATLMLELVPLRSSLPTGLLTLRHQIPMLNPVFELNPELDPELDPQLNPELDPELDPELQQSTITTTPQVLPAGEAAETETAAGKGGDAR